MLPLSPGRVRALGKGSLRAAEHPRSAFVYTKKHRREELTSLLSSLRSGVSLERVKDIAYMRNG